jgi:hypothetical protein
VGVFRILLLLLFACILGYTVIVVAHHGIGLLGVFFGDIAAMSLLTLSALWLSWRHHFSPLGIVLGMMGFFGGGLFLCAYLFFASFSAGGDMKVLLLGKYRAMG